jgi:hypothetical protein
MNLTNFIKESCFVAIMTKKLKQINNDLLFIKETWKATNLYNCEILRAKNVLKINNND